MPESPPDLVTYDGTYDDAVTQRLADRAATFWLRLCARGLSHADATCVTQAFVSQMVANMVYKKHEED